MLSSSESNVTIRYTLDGSDPSASSTAYTTAFSVGTGLTVKAKAFRADGSSSDLSSAAYTFNYGTLRSAGGVAGWRESLHRQPGCLCLGRRIDHSLYVGWQ